MNKDILTSFRPAMVMTLLFALLLGLVYPLVLTGIGQAIFPSQANGSLIEANGRVIGSALIGQGFMNDRYFHPRPSAAGKGYDGLASSGSNFGPTSKALVARVAQDIKTEQTASPGRPVPSDLVTASASGLDPHISPDAAFYQVDRIARVRGLAPAQVRALVQQSIEQPILGFIGERQVNVLEINRRLDQIGASQSL
ncbi:potassium-transporting ATPase subunit KdpC [Sphingobium sp. EM0848]|uniref:potassium-transporting ATPase subunit KdpC n=1 Tax=Sphingobium sp. EM0848 TaxID=2743473 RepID=UPI00159CA977|nr:potassium-transporting ATPase subunit KdpC [Sphingobium sp. EM0848]